MGDTTTTTNAPQQPNLLGGAPTTTQDVSGDLTPREAPSTPQPQVDVPGTPQANAKVVTADQQNQPTTPTQQSPAAQEHAKWYDKLLKMGVGGDIKVVNPDGTVRVVGQSRASMGKAILASAIAAMITPTQYRQGEYGPMVDYGATGAAAAKSSNDKMQQLRNQPQQLSDEQYTRKLKFIENNSRMMALGFANANAKRTQEDQHAADAKPFMDTLHEYDQNRPDDPSIPKAVLYEGLTHDEAMALAKQPGSGFSENNFVWDGGTKPVIGANGEMEKEATYAIINPNLKNLKVSESMADKLSKLSPQWDDLHKRIGGTANIPQNMWVHAWHDYSNYQTVNDAINRLNQTINGKDAKAIDISDIIRSDKRLLPAMDKLVQGLAHPENGQAEGENPGNLLDNILKNAPALLKPLGLTTGQAFDKVSDFGAKRAEAMARAKNAGTAKEEADPAYVQGLVAAAQTLPENQQKDVLPTLQQDVVTKREAEKVATAIKGYQTSNQSDATRKALQGGDPQTIAKLANQVVRGDLNDIAKLPSRGEGREKAMVAIHDAAAALGLDTTKYTESYIEKVKVPMEADYNSRNRKTTGAQIGSFDAYLGHTAAAIDALEALKSETIGLTRQPVINQASDAVGKQLTNNANWKRWETALAPVRNEIENFLAAGYKPSEAEQQMINQVLDKHETPARIFEAIKSLAETADIRLAAIGKGYTETMDKNFHGLLSPDAVNTLKRMRIPSKAAAYSGNLAKGWDADGKMQNLTNVPLAKQYVAAAGGDRQRAIDLARANGWILQ
jgi:hypothetical protein